MRILLPFFYIIGFFSLQLRAQEKPSGTIYAPDELKVIETIDQLFDAMRTEDAAKAKACFQNGAKLYTAMIRRGMPILHDTPLDEFIKRIGEKHEMVWDEKLWSYDIRIRGNLATVWSNYTFYLGEKKSHCGVNAFQLFLSQNGWKIIQITDTRESEGCYTSAADSPDKKKIGHLLDSWHFAASAADYTSFFDKMLDDAVYVGTDATEKWAKPAFMEWAKTYFERESAWAFTPKERQIYFSSDGKTAWFDELLDTWMGDCRGSGVLRMNGVGQWKIAYYHLAVTVPNDKIQDFIKLVEGQ